MGTPDNDYNEVVSSIKTNLYYLDSKLDSIKKSEYRISLNQGTISEDGFIEKIFKDINRIIYEYPLIPIPRFDLECQKKCLKEIEYTNIMINQFSLIIKKFKNDLNLIQNKSQIEDAFNMFKKRVEQSYYDFKNSRNYIRLIA